MKIAFVVNDVTTEESYYTTTRLAMSATNLGHETWVLGMGDFGSLVHTMATDPALIWWLDGPKNTAKAPNENLGRELLELHTVGRGHYGEADVVASAV